LYTAADLIQALQRRLLLAAPHRRRPPGEFPPGWQDWFASMQARIDAVTGASAQSLVDIFLQRPLAERPRRSGELTRWQAFNTLWRQEWHGPEPEDRKVRWFAGVFTVLWHLFVGGMLLWLMYVQFLALEEEASKRRGQVVVQVEFIGRGTPEEVGGGETQQQPQENEEAAAPAEAAAAVAPSDVAADVAAPAAPSLEAPIPEVEQREVAEPQVPSAPPEQQNVVVSAPTPEAADFVLPPTRPRTQPQIAAPEVKAPTKQVQAVEVPEPVQPIRREIPLPTTVAPQVEARIPEVAQREVAAPLPRVQVREVATPALAQPTVRTPETNVRTREIPVPRATATTQTPSPTGTSPKSTAATTPARQAATSAPSTSGTPSTSRPSGTTPSTVTAGQGPKPIAAPGSFPTPAKADDWGASTRNVPGGQRGEPHGLYNAEGGPRLTESPVNTGQPPGTLDDRIIDLDRSGTWLKRKPNDYEPTTFDKYWRPHETLLAEWVRKGIKKMSIPIPGTNKKIECLVSMLALGGGCGISDPNLNDQPAGARPPPDIPFKPHLQEDNGSVKP
jgi:hypothetical protein